MNNSDKTSVALIVAMASNRVIGRNNQLPWYLPNDLKYFKATTMGKPIIMGRKTYESIGKPLPGRTNIVLTTNKNFSAEGVKVVHSVEQALSVADAVAALEGAQEVMVIGGAEIYSLMLPTADRLYLTEVKAEVDGDAFFPELDWSAWQERGREDFAAEGPNPFDYSFVVFDRGCVA
jgi:dihydrofolate reductase